MKTLHSASVKEPAPRSWRNAKICGNQFFVTDIGLRKEVWRARHQFFSGDYPCSTLVEVSALATPELLVEINAVGFIGAG
jgi:enamine deaminase RidA (YjgF/YER057c/UK114 family)